jgi:predicted methyltransferase MtxX (methanogen marker protein 4)
MKRKAMEQQGAFSDKVDQLIRLGSPTIGFGLTKPNSQILESLRRANCARIILVGPPDIKTIEHFEVIVAEAPEERLAAMLVRGDVEGIVRGTIDDLMTREAYKRMTGESPKVTPALLETPKIDGKPPKQFFIGPLSNRDGWTLKSRLDEAIGTADFVREWGIEPKIAVYAGIRDKTHERQKHETEGIVSLLNRTYVEADEIVRQLSDAGYSAKNWTIDFDRAIGAGYNIHIPVSGLVGNQLYRMLLVCGGRPLATPLLGLSRHWEDNSRNETDFEFHVRWLTAMINKNKLARG